MTKTLKNRILLPSVSTLLSPIVATLWCILSSEHLHCRLSQDITFEKVKQRVVKKAITFLWYCGPKYKSFNFIPKDFSVQMKNVC